MNTVSCRINLVNEQSRANGAPMEKDLDVYSRSPCGDYPFTVTGNLYFKTQAMSNMSAYMSALALSLHSIRIIVAK